MDWKVILERIEPVPLGLAHTYSHTLLFFSKASNYTIRRVVLIFSDLYFPEAVESIDVV